MLPAAAAILWRSLDGPGHDSARLSVDGGRAVIDGMAVFAMDGASCAVAYRVACDDAWRTVSADVDGWLGDATVSMRIRRDGSGRWTVNGTPVPSLDGCDDVDLAVTPATNALPIRRLGLKVGEKADVPAAWWNPPSIGLTRLEQTYERIGPSTYRYTSGHGAFETVLVVRHDGLVTRYPGLWEEEEGQTFRSSPVR